jgi:integrase
VLHQRKGNCSAFNEAWRVTIRQALKETKLEEGFSRHDLRRKEESDVESDERAMELLGHGSTQITRKHYRVKRKLIMPTR